MGSGSIDPTERGELFESPWFLPDRGFRSSAPVSWWHGANGIGTPHDYKIPISRAADPNRKYTALKGISAPVWSYQKEHPMLDIAMLVLGAIFFAGTIAYAYACDRL